MTSPLPANRIAGLDGMRAIAVALVLAYHLLPPSWTPSGLIGVDVFFVISGFLITTLLIDAHRRTGRRGLVDFWRRRARRILPALVVVIVLFATGAWLFGGDAAVGLDWQVAGASTFTYNWVSIANGGGYFALDTPELFRNLWSLAVEEQFYLLWPLILPVFLAVRRPLVRGLCAVVPAASSLTWMIVLIQTTGQVDRAYLGTDSHAFGLLLGVALAFLLERRLAGRAVAAAPVQVRLVNGWIVVPPRPPAPAAPVKGVGLGRAIAVIGLIAVAGIVVVALLAPTSLPATLGAATALTGIVIVACVWPHSWLGTALDVAPLRWLGSRSYAVYLWHWPLLVLIAGAAGDDAWIAQPPLQLGAGVIVLSLVFAELSYRFVERPMRQRGFRGTARLISAWLQGGFGARLRALGMLAVGVLLVATTTAAVALAPTETTAQESVSAGEAALRASGSASPRPHATASHPVLTPSPLTPIAATPAPLPPVTGDEITAIGDSVMLASAGGLLERYPGIEVDAKVSRSMYAAPGILQTMAQTGRLRRYVVVALGTNGPVSDRTLADVLQIVGPDRTLVLVNAFAPRSWIPGVNETLTAFAAAHPGEVVIADWSDAIAPDVGLLAPDHIHPGKAGGRIFASAVSDAIVAAQEAELASQTHYQKAIGQLVGKFAQPGDRTGSGH